MTRYNHAHRSASRIAIRLNVPKPGPLIQSNIGIFGQNQLKAPIDHALKLIEF